MRRPKANRADALKRQAYAAAPKLKDTQPCRQQTGALDPVNGTCLRCAAAEGERCRERR